MFLDFFTRSKYVENSEHLYRIKKAAMSQERADGPGAYSGMASLFSVIAPLAQAFSANANDDFAKEHLGNASESSVFKE